MSGNLTKGIIIGMILGALIGVIIHDTALGIGIGTAVGIAIASLRGGWNCGSRRDEGKGAREANRE
jgi:hypothetical protein